MAEVTYDNATCIYPGAERPAVDGLELGIKDGEFVVMVGPSGCGKTTALRMLAGRKRSTGGVRIDGRDMTRVPSATATSRWSSRTTRCTPAKRSPRTWASRSRCRAWLGAGPPGGDAAKLLDLEQLLDRKPRNLSGGQRQRVAMGRALFREPKVFCMDEPLSNLDAQLRVQTRTQIAELQRRLGVTTVY